MKTSFPIFVLCAFMVMIASRAEAQPGATVSGVAPTLKCVHESTNGEENFRTFEFGVTAPGDNILSTVLNDQVAIMRGTSMAAPHVAGVAALVLERNPNLTATQVREILARSAKKVGNYEYDTVKEFGTWNERYGYGLIDAYNAVINTPRH